MEKIYWKFYLENFMKSGIFFGQITHKLNKYMYPFTYAKHKHIHIINITITSRFLSEACNLVFNAASNGKDILIIGTKSTSSSLVELAANKSRCHYVNRRWLRGMLTNWYTTEKILYKLRNLIAEKFFNKINYLKTYAFFKYNFNGIKYMKKLPDIIILVDHNEYFKIIKECSLLRIPIIVFIDINYYPYISDFYIPSNDDTIDSIKFILTKLIYAICKGRSIYINKKIKIKNK
uniref:Small ribosomal subunit protein uS2c n=1 Tax=Epipogium aphyllum TaxID=449980 RepID=A0A0B4PLE3_9ASPA|nr:ribosomal protein S2 [Epipogium aphyllum]